jgi:hypothetical protein
MKIQTLISLAGGGFVFYSIPETLTKYSFVKNANVTLQDSGSR